MNLEIERKIVKSFVIKTRAERIIYELSSKKRRECIWKLSKELFIPDYCTEADLSKAEILKILCNNGVGKECYVMSIDEEIDGKEIKLSEALEKVLGRGPAFVSYIHGKLAYFEGEQEKGTPERVILSRRY